MPQTTSEPADERPGGAGEADGKNGGRSTAVLLAAAAVVAAILGGRASLVSSSASGSWQQAVRQEVKRSAALVEDVRFVYSDEAATAFLLAEARIRSEELRRAAADLSGSDRALVLAEASAYETLAEGVGTGTELVEVREYATSDGGFDLGRRLVDVRNENPDLVALDPEAAQSVGDDAGLRARLGVAATIPVAGAFLFGALGQGFPRRRRPLLAAGFVLLGLGVLAGILVETVVA